MTTRSLTTTSPSDRRSAIGLFLAVFFICLAQLCDGAYYGKLIGKLSELHHGVSGEVYAVDGRTLFIKDFTYDGEGPAAFFYAGSSKSPNSNGFRVRDERGTQNVLKRYRKKDITLTLPDGKTLNSIKWFSVWCDEFAVNFGDVRIPRGFDYPKPQKLASLSGVHGVSSEPIVIVDAQTLLIPGFSYDGEAPDAKFWVGAGPSPSPQGIRVPDENGKEQPLRRYDHKTIVLTLPGDLTVHQIGHFGVWCEAFAVDFGHIQIQQGLNVPPSLKMLGVSPQSKLNCEVLDDTLAFEVRWAVAGDSIVVQLVGKLEAGQYMAFGLSPNLQKSVMIGGDLAVAWVDKETLQGYAIDYFLEAKSQCSGGRGSCPDTRIRAGSNSIRLLNAAMVNGYSIVTYQRPLKASDELDLAILTNRSQAIIWAVGPLNERQEVSYHSNYLKTDRFIEFGRPPAWNCPIPDQEQPSAYDDNDERETVNQQQLAVTTRRPPRLPATPAPAPKNQAWEIPPIECYEPDDGVFYAQMGPTGGKHGYPAITGHVGWGISWYINGLLIPEINVVRGMKYTFVVEGGQNPDTPARYHPFYITDDPIGGYQHKTPEERAKVKIFAGVRRQRGTPQPTGVGRLCNWVPDQNQPHADEFASFGAYQRTLTLVCDPGEPGIVEWTPDENTPDTVYYQCFTHRYLGWKINVHDSCDAPEGTASENHEVYVEAKDQEAQAEDLDVSPSIRVSSKVTPTAEFLQQHLHHPHHREYGLRYPHYTATTNSGKLSTSYAQILTNANNHNNYERFRTSAVHEDPYGPRSNHGVVPHHYEVRVKESYRHAHLDEEAQQRQQQHHHHQQQQQGGIGTVNRPASTSSTSATITSTPFTSYPGRPQFTEIEQEIGQSSNHQLSNLVADNPRPLSHGMKFAYTLPATQIVYSRPTSHHYAPDHHHLHHLLHYHQHQPEQQRTQVMIVRRPVLMRRPVLQTSHTINSSPTYALPPSRSIYMERKKAVYKVPTSEKITYGNIAKLMKLDPKQRTKLEAKVSEAALMDISEELMASLKPARNTGFDPGSIVIEGGFKPIVGPSRDAPQKRISENEQEETTGKADFSGQRSDENFEPVFLPSPSVETAFDGSKKQKKKTISTNVNRTSKPSLGDLDDMEMAADGLQSYYLPPAARAESSQQPSSGVLITFDGKRVKDSTLARSITELEDHSRSGLPSDVLSRTPQFGRFKGELPPPIPGETRSDRTIRVDRNGQQQSLPSLDLASAKSRKNTKLTLIERSKRSPRENRTMSSTEFRRSNGNATTSTLGEDDNLTTQGSTGQTILANIKYVILTVILYYVL